MGKESKRGGLKKDHLSVEASEEAPGMVAFILKPVVHIFLITVIGLIVYANTFSVPFLFDDTNTILKNILLRSAGYFANKPLYELFFAPRIIGQLTFALNYAAHDLDVAGYHIVNLVIHISCALLVYWFVVLIFRTPYFAGYFQGSGVRDQGSGIRGQGFVALFASLLFVSHPLQTQAVTYIVQRYASLATLFYLLSLVMYIRFRLSERPLKNVQFCSSSRKVRISTTGIHLVFRGLKFEPDAEIGQKGALCKGLSESSKARHVFYAVSIFSAVLAMKTKEIAFTLPVMITLCEFMFFQDAIKKRVGYLIPLILTMAIIPLSLIGTQGISPRGAIVMDQLTQGASLNIITPLDYLNTQFRVIVTYIRLLFLPINQNLDYDYPIYKTFFTPPVYLSFLFLLSVFGYVVYLLYRSFREDGNGNKVWHRLIAFGIIWFFVTLSVESSIIPIADVIFEHRLYLPSVGFIIAVIAVVAWFAVRIENSLFMQKLILCVMVLVVLSLSVAAYARNIVWQSEISLWEDTVKKSPGKTRGQYNLGLLYSKQGRLDEAIGLYETAIRLSPDYYRPYNDLGNAYFNQGRLDDAFKEYQHALALKPDYAESHNNIGIVYVKKGRYDEAIGEFLLALKFKPKYADAHANLGNVFYEKRRFSEALRHYEDALKIKPDHAMAQRQIEMIYRIQGKP